MFGHTEVIRGANSFVKSAEGQSAIFFQRFLRNYRLLDFIACRVLGDEERAFIAVQNYWRTASRNPPHFEYEGAFRSWLVRVLIDEVLAILRESYGERHGAAAAVSAVSLSDNTAKPGLG
jgi:DNA-directed RNA polymerase specialized sigma24 family protein